MSHSLFQPPGEDMLRPKPVKPDALTVRSRGGAIRAPKSKGLEATPVLDTPEPVQEKAEPKRKSARLMNPTLEAKSAYFWDKVNATVEAEIPDPDSPRRVLLELFAISPEGERQRIQGAEKPVPKNNLSRAEFTLFQPEFRNAEGQLLDACSYVLRATHPDAKPVESPPFSARRNPDKPFEGLIFYSPERQEYLLFETEEEAEPLLKEILKLEQLRERSRQAWTLPDPSKRMEALDKAAQESDALFEGKSTGSAKRGVEELLLVDNRSKKAVVKGWNYIPNATGEGKTPWKYGLHRFKRSEVQEKRAKLLKQGETGRKSPLFDSQVTLNLFKPKSKSDQWLEFRTPESKGDSEAEIFTWNGEAALGRYMLGWDGGEASFDLNKKTLKVGASGQVSASLFEGKVSGTLHLPDPKGVNVLGWLQEVKYGQTYLVDPTRVCLMKLCLDGSLSAFVGVSLQGAVAFPSLCFEGQSEGKQKAEVSASGSAFAGGQVEVGAKVGIHWAASATTPFQTLGDIAYELGASVGVGAEGGLKVEYSGGKFTFEMSAAVAWGLGCKGGAAFEVSAEEGWKILGHILDCVDFHLVKEIAEDAYEAFAAYSIMMNLAEQQRARAQIEWSKAQGQWVGRRFEALRNWFLKGEAEFLLAKLALKNQAGLRSTLMKMSPEALGLTLALIMKTREDSDFDVIMLILNSTTWRKDGKGAQVSTDHKLKWVLRYVTGTPKFEGPEKEKLKQTSLAAGIKKINDFGKGIGYSEYSDTNFNFFDRFQTLLKLNGLIA